MNSIRTVIGSTCLAALVAAAFGCSSDGDGDDGASGAGGGAGMSAGGSMAGTGTAGAPVAGAPVAGAPAAGAPAGGAPAGGAPAGGAPAGGAPAGGAPAGGAPAGGSGGAAVPTGLPASDSKDALLSFIKAGTYKAAPWKSETAAPRAKASGSPHDKVRVWMNEPLLNSFKTGMEKSPAQYSMAVKELYSATDELVGHAVTYHAGAGKDANSYTYWCVGPADRCYTGAPAATEAAPIYGKGIAVQCGYCHSALAQPFITPPPP